MNQTTLNKIKDARLYVRQEFKSMSDKEVIETFRLFSNIKNLLNKEFQNNTTNYLVMKNKMIALLNTYQKDYVVRRMRKESDQTIHPLINSIFVYMKVIPISKDIPCDVDFFKKICLVFR